MTGDQGGQALKSAVPLFITNFNDLLTKWR